MKWFVIACFLLWARHGEGGALKCATESGDAGCPSEIQEIESKQSDPETSASTLEPWEPECLPGSEWESNCYSCHCWPEGAALCRRQSSCNSPDTEPMRCKPNTAFKRECNTCYCGADGYARCTDMFCGKVSDPETPASTLDPMEMECLPGSEWESNCHSCRCSPEGAALCRRQSSCNSPDTEPMRCKPKTAFKRECNTCYCGADGYARCTDIFCGKVSDLESPAPRLEPSEAECLPGSEWESNCHSCRCSPEGAAVCRRQNSCDSPYTEPILCKPNTTFERECNTCNCLDNGHVLCTLMFCVKMPARAPSKEALPKGQDCAPGSEWTSGCNDCKCSPEGLRICSSLRCSEGQETEPLLRCAPHSLWMKECNTCWCTSDGRAMCTRIGCVGIPSDMHFSEEQNEPDSLGSVEPGVDHIERHSVCKPSSTFFVGCNPCNCNVDGTDFSCTNKSCPLPEDVEVFHELNALKSAIKANVTKKKVCVENRMFIMDCNTCWCNEDGTSYMCTRRVCIPNLQDEPEVEDSKLEKLRIIKRECRPDEVFELDCNMCRCDPDGKSFSCTRRACVDEDIKDVKNETLMRKVRAVPQESPKTCQPGQEFRMDCNKCLCDNEGQDFSCTRIDCNALNNNNKGGTRRRRDVTHKVPADCVPGSVFDQGCNVCRCTEDGGHATCTLKRCPNKEDNKVSTTESSFRCNPGEQFKQSCNDCSCSADGKSVFCTLFICDEDLTP